MLDPAISKPRRGIPKIVPVYLFALPFFLGWLTSKDIHGLSGPHPLWQWLPQWSRLAAIWALGIWPFFLCPETGHAENAPARPSARLKPCLLGQLLAGLVIWLLWGRADILPTFLINSALGLSPVLCRLYESASRISSSYPQYAGCPPAPKPLDRTNLTRLAGWSLANFSSALCFIAAALVAYTFGVRHGMKLSGPHVRHWLGTIPWFLAGWMPCAMAYHGWHIVRANFPAAKGGRFVAGVFLVCAPWLAGAALLARLLPPPMPLDIAVPGLIGMLVAIVVINPLLRRIRRRRRDQGRQETRP